MRSLRTFFLSGFLFVISYNIALGQFAFYGKAQELGGGCYMLTPDTLYAVGSIWYKTQIDLNSPFDLQYDLNFGARDADGADGIVFVLHTDTNTFLGNIGSGSTIGYGNIAPSLGIEFDTWRNIPNSDPVFDHLAIHKNGDVNHVNNLAGPVQIDATNANVEDSASHRIRITWNPADTIINVYFDCQLRLSYSGDIINQIWSGNSKVYWGFTSATGSKKNRHSICLVYASFVNYLNDTSICAGKSLQLSLPNLNASYQWSPSSFLNNATIYNPIATPSVTTTYYVSITDTCGVQANDTVTINVNSVPIANAGVDVSICSGENTILTASGGGSYAWVPAAGLSSTVSATPQASPAATTTYSLMVTGSNGCTANSSVVVTVNIAPDAYAGEDTSICRRQNAQLSASGGNDYLWTPSTGLNAPNISNPLAGPEITTQYILTVNNGNGCSDTDTLTVTVDECEPSFIIVPNIFTPNGDGINDFFEISYSSLKEYNIDIFNRWGILVYHGTSPASSWNGSGSSDGTYYYVLKATGNDDLTYDLSGFLTLLR